MNRSIQSNSSSKGIRKEINIIYADFYEKKKSQNQIQVSSPYSYPWSRFIITIRKAFAESSINLPLPIFPFDMFSPSCYPPQSQKAKDPFPAPAVEWWIKRMSPSTISPQTVTRMRRSKSHINNFQRDFFGTRKVCQWTILDEVIFIW